MKQLPSTLRRALESLLTDYPWLADPDCCRGCCLAASLELLRRLGITANQHRYLGQTPPGTPVAQEHHWVVFQGWAVDVTARQFDPAADFPKIWPVT